MTLNFLLYYTVYYRFFRIIYFYFIQPFNSNVVWTLFLLVFYIFVAFHFLSLENGMAATSWPVLVVTPRLDYTTHHPSGKLQRAGADFPPNREHYSRHTRWNCFWPSSTSFKVVNDERPSSMHLCRARKFHHYCHRGFSLLTILRTKANEETCYSSWSYRRRRWCKLPPWVVSDVSAYLMCAFDQGKELDHWMAEDRGGYNKNSDYRNAQRGTPGVPIRFRRTTSM